MAAEDRRYLEQEPRLDDEEELDLESAEEMEVSRIQALLQDRRKIASGIALVVLLIVAIYVLFPKIVGADEAVSNLDDAVWYWVVVAIGFNVLAFGAYVALFRGVLGGTRDDESLTLQVPGDGRVRSLRALLDRLDRAGLEVGELSVHTPDLDDVFLALTGDGTPGTGTPLHVKETLR